MLLQCSVSCGEGTRIRSMKCLAGNGTEVSATHCADKQPHQRIEACHRGECPVWRESEWDQVQTYLSESPTLMFRYISPQKPPPVALSLFPL